MRHVQVMALPPVSAAEALGEESGVVLPSQFGADARVGAAAQPEARLLLAVLEQALEEVMHPLPTPRGWRNFVDAARWFAVEGSRWPFAFVNVCHVVGIDPEYVRAQVRRVRGSGVFDVEPEPVRRRRSSRRAWEEPGFWRGAPVLRRSLAGRL